MEQSPAATGKDANFGRIWTNFGRKDSFGDADKLPIKVRHHSAFPSMDRRPEIAVVETRKSKEIVLEAAEKRAQPMHLR